MRIAPNQTPTSGSLFAGNFALTLADDRESLARVSRIRYQVYCEELGFQLDQHDGREEDEYDPRSLHCLLHHYSTGLDAGCIRLVLPASARSSNLPFEACGLDHIDKTLLNWQQLDPARCCEVSRLAVAPAFRQRMAEQGGELGGSRLPVVAMSLYHAVMVLILDLGYEHVFMVNEVRLQRHLQRYGIRLQQISPEFDYFGRRAVFATNREQLQWEIDNWRSDWRGLYDEVSRQLLGRAELMRAAV